MSLFFNSISVKPFTKSLYIELSSLGDKSKHSLSSSSTQTFYVLNIEDEDKNLIEYIQQKMIFG